jgi:hypothetical protein
MPTEPDIHCPKCQDRPRAEDRWVCIPRCGTVWHTFWTGGVCPGCGVQWTETQCLACGKISPHKDWYHYPEGETPADREIIDAPEKVSAGLRMVGTARRDHDR